MLCKSCLFKKKKLDLHMSVLTFTDEQNYLQSVMDEEINMTLMSLH